MNNPFLMTTAAKFNAEVTDNAEETVITNRANGKTITIYEEKYYAQDGTELFVEYIVCFARQHRHCEDLSDAAEYVEEIMRDEVLPMEFYLDGKPCFGGEISPADWKNLSVASLERYWNCPAQKLLNYIYEIHSWSGKFDTGKRKVSELLTQKTPHQ